MSNKKTGLDALLTPDDSVLLLIDHQPFQFADAALDQAAGHESLAAEIVGGLLVDAVDALDRVRTSRG
jgi:hypothetical protein